MFCVRLYMAGILFVVESIQAQLRKPLLPFRLPRPFFRVPNAMIQSL